MGKRGNKLRKDNKEKTVAQNVLSAAAKASQEAIEMAYGDPFGSRDEPEPANDTVDPIDPLGDQGDGQDAYGRTIDVDKGHPKHDLDDIVPWEATEEGLKLLEHAKAGPEREKGGGAWRVSIVKDSMIEYPDLYYEVYVAGDRWTEASFAEMFVRAGCTRAKAPDEADLVVFTGGADVDPQLYGEKPHVKSKIQPYRDEQDYILYKLCLDLGIPMLGICRGSQFLHVMNGGKLYQHVDGHVGPHKIIDIRTKEVIDPVSSTHHQMVIFKEGMELIATANNATERWRNPAECDRGSSAEVEAYFYPETLCLGIQGHPEYKLYDRFTKWSLSLINEYFTLNPDVDWLDGHRRLKPDLLGMRSKQKTPVPQGIKGRK